MAFSGPSNRTEIKPANIDPTDFGSNQLGRTWPLLRGLHKVGALWLTDIFAQRINEVKREVQTGKDSSEDMTTSIQYFLSYAVGLGIGPLTRLMAISGSDEEIWSGDLAFAANTPQTVDVPERGAVTFYPGGLLQPRDPVLAAKLSPTVPAFRRRIYAVLDDFFVGTTESPPNIEFTFSSVPQLLVLDPENGGSDPSADRPEYHAIDHNVNPAEFAWELLTDPVWGAGLSAAELDRDSFVAAANHYLTDGWGIAPSLTQFTDYRAVLAQLSDHAALSLRRKGGLFRAHVLRSANPVLSIPEADLVEEPRVSAGGVFDTVARLSVSFSNSARKLETDEVVVTDPVAVRRLGAASLESLERTWLNRIEQADRLAAAEGRRRAFPVLTVSAEVSGSLKETVFPGDRIQLPGVGPVLLVKETRLPAASDDTLEIEAESDVTHLFDLGGYGVDFTYEYPGLDAVPAFARVAAMPAALLPAGYADGMLAFVSVPDEGTVTGDIYFSADGTAYDTVLAATRALRVELLKWKDCNNGYGVLDVRFTSAAEHAVFQALVNAGALVDYFVCLGRRTVKTSAGIDLPEPEPLIGVVRYSAPVTSLDGSAGYGAWDWRLRVESGQFSTVPWAREQGGVPGIVPATVGFLGFRSSVGVITSNQLRLTRTGPNGSSDTEQVRHFRVTTRKGTSTVDVSEADDITWDRDGEPAEFTADPVTDLLTLSGPVPPEGTPVRLSTSGTLPDPLAAETVYFVRDVAGVECALSVTLDGPPLDLTDVGSGTHTMSLVNGTFAPDWGPAALNDQAIGDPLVPEDQLT